MSTSYTAAGFAIRKLCHLAERPTLPEISDDMLVSGEWAATLVNLVSPYADELADLLGAAWPPGHDALRGQRSASERVEAALRVIDAADLSSATGSLDRAERSLAERRRQPTGPTEADKTRAELAELGIQV